MVSCLEIARTVIPSPTQSHGDETAFLCPNHNDHHPSLLVNGKKNTWLCGPCGQSGGAWKLAAFLCHLDAADKPGIGRWLREHGLMNQIPRSLAKDFYVKALAAKLPVKTWYHYQDTDGTRFYSVARVEYELEGKRHKEFPIAGPDGRWTKKAKLEKIVPYNLPELAQAKEVWVVEGEKDVETLRTVGLVATTAPGFAQLESDWVKYSVYFRANQDVIILPDNDEAGTKKAQAAASALKPVALTCVTVTLPDLPAGGDVSDFCAGKPSADCRIALEKLWKETPLDAIPLPVATPQLQSSPGSNQLHLVLAELSLKHSVVMAGSKTAILTLNWDEEREREAYPLLSIPDFRNYYLNKRIEGVSIADLWLKHPDCPHWEGLVFAPGKQTGKKFNLWRGFGVKPKAGNCDYYLMHLHDNVAQGDESLYRYVLAWMAYAVQYPDRKPGTALVFRGGEGVGKGIVFREFGKLFGSHFRHINTTELLVGRFNSHLMAASVVFADEAFYAGDRQHENTLKHLITEPTLTIEYKGREPFEVSNFIHLVMSSNSQWVVPAGMRARRFQIIDVGEGKIQDTHFFGALQNQMDNGGREALLHYLQNYDLTDFDPFEIIQTEALKESKVLTFDDIKAWWFNRLKEGVLDSLQNEWEERIDTRELYRSYFKEVDALKIRYIANETKFGMQFRKLVQNLQRKQVRDGAKRFWIYILPSLEECRNHFDEIMGCKNNWE